MLLRGYECVCWISHCETPHLLKLCFFPGCYFGRGAIQISYNYNYGLFNRWLNYQGITHNGKPVDILKNPNLIMTKTDPPLSILASLWFYMTPQSPKPAMHDIVIGNCCIVGTKYNPSGYESLRYSVPVIILIVSSLIYLNRFFSLYSQFKDKYVYQSNLSLFLNLW